MVRNWLAIWLLCLPLVLLAQGQFAHQDVRLLMGTRFEIAAYATSQQQADVAVAAAITEVERIEALISSWQPTSQTSLINQSPAGTPVQVDRELSWLIERSLKISSLTDGAFDISAGAGLRGLYRFAGQDTTLPAPQALQQCRERIDAQSIRVNAAESTVTLQGPGMSIGFGGIGKGYAANRARSVMRALEGVTGGVINAAGDIATFGTTPEGEAWTIGISDPRDPTRWLGQLAVHEAAVVTSGDYEKYFTSDGVRYAHIIDPRTCLPTRGVRSVTVINPDAEIADALATACFILGAREAVSLIDRLKDTEVLLVTEAGQLIKSKGLTLAPYEAPTTSH